MDFFNWQDYIEMNDDLKHLNSEKEAVEHWNKIGIEQMRLCNKKQLDVICEFGREINVFIPFYYYLYKNNLLFNNKIYTYKGMKSLYYFLDENQIIEKNENRTCNIPSQNYMPPNNRFINKNFGKNFWIPPNYKEFYKNDKYLYSKPILIIHNKYNYEWEQLPINYINIKLLDKIFDKLHDKWQIIYIRPTKLNKLANKSFSHDHNDIIEKFKDFELIKNKYKNKVINFNDLLDEEIEYNKLKLMIYSNCDNFINVQGGSCNFTSYFIGNLVVLHKKGSEKELEMYDNFYYNYNKNENKKIISSDNDYDFYHNILKMFDI
jgi:hypothetical protein